MLETTIQSEMHLANVPLRDAQLPAECLVVSIRREDELLFPRGSTVIRPGDVVTFLLLLLWPQVAREVVTIIEAREGCICGHFDL